MEDGLQPWKTAFNATADELKALYGNRAFREAFREELRGPGLFHGAWNRVTVNAAKNPELQAVEGKSVEEIARQRGKDGLDTFFDLVLEDNLALRYSMVRTGVPTEPLDDPRVNGRRVGRGRPCRSILHRRIQHRYDWDLGQGEGGVEP
jgi:N-acyl-D-aspartate/D-glutamate deacylase